MADLGGGGGTRRSPPYFWPIFIFFNVKFSPDFPISNGQKSCSRFPRAGSGGGGGGGDWGCNCPFPLDLPGGGGEPAILKR